MLQLKSPILGALLIVTGATALLLVSRLLRFECPPQIVHTYAIANITPSLCPKDSAATITDRLNTQWTRPGPGVDHIGTPLQSHLGVVDRIDVYHNVTKSPGKSSILFAYRHSVCPDEHRSNPSKLFTNEAFAALPEGGVYVDIGACYGDTSVQLGIKADMLIAFEPNPFAYRVLEVNALLNPGLNVKVHHVAVGDGTTSELEFTYGGGGAMCNGGVLGAWKSAASETPLRVPAVHLPTFLHSVYGEDVLKKISVIKVDAEGYDSTIIGTLKPLLPYSKFVIFTEWFDFFVSTPPHGHEGPDGVHHGAKALFDAIADLGYEPFDPITGNRIPGPQNKYKVKDILCKRKP